MARSGQPHTQSSPQGRTILLFSETSIGLLTKVRQFGLLTKVRVKLHKTNEFQKNYETSLLLSQGLHKIFFYFTEKPRANSSEQGRTICIGTSEKRSFCHSLEEGNPGSKAKNKL